MAFIIGGSVVAAVAAGAGLYTFFTRSVPEIPVAPPAPLVVPTKEDIQSFGKKQRLVLAELQEKKTLQEEISSFSQESLRSVPPKIGPAEPSFAEILQNVQLHPTKIEKRPIEMSEFEKALLAKVPTYDK